MDIIFISSLQELEQTLDRMQHGSITLIDKFAATRAASSLLF